MKKIFAVVALALVAAMTMPVAAQSASGGIQRIDRSAAGAMNYLHLDENGNVLSTDPNYGRQGKVVSYDNIWANPYYYFTGNTNPPGGPRTIAADDIHFDKSAGKMQLNRFDFQYYCPPPGGTCGTAKIDLYDSLGLTVLPSSSLRILQVVTGTLPSGFNTVSVTLNTPIDKPADIWASIQWSDTRAGIILGGGNGPGPFNQHPLVGYSSDLFAGNTLKENNAGWRALYFGGAPIANFGWRFWNSPEPTTMLLVLGGAAALLRKRR